FRSVGRLRDGVSASRAASDVAAVYVRFRRAFPELVPSSTDGAPALATYREVFVGQQETVLWILFGATAFVLVLACANVANLLLARTLTRQREFAVRSALGAGRGRV